MSKLFLTDVDRVVLEELRVAGVLKCLELLPARDVTDIHIGLMCPDGHQALELQEAHYRMTGRQLHVVGDVHGGASAMCPSCMLHDVDDQFPHQHYIHKIVSASRIKGTSVVYGYSHFPCGQATTKGVNAPTLIELQMRALSVTASACKQRGCELVFQPALHVDLGFDKKRSYRLDPQDWDAIKARYAHLIDSKQLVGNWTV